MYRIGQFSLLGKTTIKTLRHYDEVGLLKPEQVDGQTGYRYYTTRQLHRLHEIVALRQMGFSVPEVLQILDGQRVEQILCQRKAEVESELDVARDRLFRLEHYIRQRKEGGPLTMYQAVVKQIPECIVFSKRTRIPDYSALTGLVPSVGEAVGKANLGLACAQPEYCFNIYHDGEYKDHDIDVEICQAVTRAGKETDGIVFKTISQATVVSVLHKGPYQELGAAYAAVFQWIQDNGYQAADNPRESYIDGIWNKESEADWLTEVQVPVEKKA